MEITHKQYDGLRLIIIHGTINRNADAALNEIILNTPATEECHLWIDCSNIKEIIRVNFSLSDFLNYLLQLRNQGLHILLYGADDTIKRMLRLLKLDKTFKLVATLDDAYLTLSQSLALTS